jgi:hypothetical protein
MFISKGEGSFRLKVHLNLNLFSVIQMQLVLFTSPFGVEMATNRRELWVKVRPPVCLNQPAWKSHSFHFGPCKQISLFVASRVVVISRLNIASGVVPR